MSADGKIALPDRSQIRLSNKEDMERVNKLRKKTDAILVGIGAGNGVDGQVLVLHDMLGMTHEFNPRFLRRYLNLYEDINKAVKNYVDDVKNQDFPNENEEY